MLSAINHPCLAAVRCRAPIVAAGARYIACRYASSKALVYDQPGEPLDVLKLKEIEVPSVGQGQVEVKWLKAPINPSDINTVQGKYPIQPKLPGGIPGHEGVGVVTAVGPQVSGLQSGDWVVPLEPNQGTWRQRGVAQASALHRVPSDMSMDDAATLCINPPSALAMLRQFVELKPGDTVIQNGANSAVGQAVIQLCKAMGVHSVNIIRDRPDWDATAGQLQALGADVVTTEAKLKEALKAAKLPDPALGLNCVGGSAALAVAKVLRPSGTMVTYGGMSMQPVTIPTSLFIFKDLSFRGFWLSGGWSKAAGPSARAALLDELVGYIQKGQLRTQCQTFPLEQWQQAVQAASAPQKSLKVLIQP